MNLSTPDVKLIPHLMTYVWENLKHPLAICDLISRVTACRDHSTWADQARLAWEVVRIFFLLYGGYAEHFEWQSYWKWEARRDREHASRRASSSFREVDWDFASVSFDGRFLQRHIPTVWLDWVLSFSWQKTPSQCLLSLWICVGSEWTCHWVRLDLKGTATQSDSSGTEGDGMITLYFIILSVVNPSRSCRWIEYVLTSVSHDVWSSLGVATNCCVGLKLHFGVEWLVSDMNDFVLVPVICECIM